MEKVLPGVCRRGYAQIDLDAVRENIMLMREKLSPETKMMGVIKTNAYGHGSVTIAKELEPLDFMYGFAVATFEEALALRDAGINKPILILGYTFPYAYQTMAKQGIRPAVFRQDQIPELVSAAKKAGEPIRVHVKVDTGMNRIGIPADDEGLAFVRELAAWPEIEIEGIFTHFARADEADKTSATRQFAHFQSFTDRLERELELRIPIKHCANSAAILELPQMQMDMVRAGITIYGLYPSAEVGRGALPLKPALSLYSEIVCLKTIHKGESVSYGGTFTASEDTKVATVPLGYGDGYPRSLSGRGYVLIHGMRAPILGRICMDQFMVDVTGIPKVKEGDRVTLIGFDGEEHISAEDLGGLSGRFNYELVSDLSLRLPRVYVKNGV